jgi:glycerophosphoryl diester phosphodiesterase
MMIIGHRGAAANAPENTIPSFAAALEAGADGVEFDVRLTADGRAVLMHDDDVSRTTDGSGFVSAMSFDEVRALDASCRFPGWGEQAQVPTLDEALELLAGRARIVVEVKGSYHEGHLVPAAMVVEAVVKSLVMVPDVLVSSFDAAAVAAARALQPHIPTGFTSFDPDAGLAIAIATGHTECHIPQQAASADFVRRAHEAGRSVLCWTVNTPRRMGELSAMGIDGVFTDDPAVLRAAL